MAPRVRNGRTGTGCLSQSESIEIPSPKRRYSDQLLNSEINQTINTSDGGSFSRSNRRNSNLVLLVLTHHPSLPKLERTITHYHHILQNSDQLWQAFPSFPIIAFRRPRNLPDLLVHSDITPKTSNLPGNFRYDARRCMTCPILVTPTHSPALWLENALN